MADEKWPHNWVRVAYSRDDLRTLQGMSLFSGDLESIKGALRRIAVGRRDDPSWGGWLANSDGDPMADGFLELIERLEHGADPIVALTAAFQAIGDANTALSQLEAASRQQAEARYAQRMAEEKLTQTVECPYCGEKPGKPCRSTGERQTARTESHKGRWRLARHLNDGYALVPGDDGEPRRCKGFSVSAGRRCRVEAAPEDDFCGGHEYPSGLPEGFAPDADMLTWAATECPSVDALAESARFAAYWQIKRQAQDPNGWRKRDWAREWRKWMDRAQRASHGDLPTSDYYYSTGELMSHLINQALSRSHAVSGFEFKTVDE